MAGRPSSPSPELGMRMKDGEDKEPLELFGREMILAEHCVASFSFSASGRGIEGLNNLSVRGGIGNVAQAVFLPSPPPQISWLPEGCAFGCVLSRINPQSHDQSIQA